MVSHFSRTLPKGWRLGQFHFNFAEWLHTHKNYDTNQSYRTADTFSIPDKEYLKLIDEYWEYLNTKGIK